MDPNSSLNLEFDTTDEELTDVENIYKKGGRKEFKNVKVWEI